MLRVRCATCGEFDITALNREARQALTEEGVPSDDISDLWYGSMCPACDGEVEVLEGTVDWEKVKRDRLETWRALLSVTRKDC